VIPYSIVSKDSPIPAVGDSVRLLGLPKPGGKLFARCEGSDYVSPGSVITSGAASFYVENAFINLPNVQFVQGSKSFTDSVNTLLDEGLYKTSLRSPSIPSGYCLTSGFALKVEKSECKEQRCGVSLINGLVAFVSTGAGKANVQSVQRTALGNVLESGLNPYIDFKSHDLFYGLMGSLGLKLKEVKF
jgi:hypothetical protein